LTRRGLRGGLQITMSENLFNSAIELMHEYVKNPSLRNHMYAVSEAMRQYSKKYGGDEDLWAAVGILHDFDWEMHPNAEEHPFKGAEILERKGYSKEIIKAVLSHADYTGVTRDTIMEKVLFACDELTGFIIACALVQPSKKLADVKPESVVKKFKKKEFARQVNREDMIKGAEILNIPLNEHVEFVLNAMRGISDKLGL
jgi:putative nucleotidyltransferase with HDIG domain